MAHDIANAQVVALTSGAKDVAQLVERCQMICGVSEAAIAVLAQEMAASPDLPRELGEMFEDLANSYLNLAQLVANRNRP